MSVNTSSIFSKTSIPASADNIALHILYTHPDSIQDIKGVVQLVHGMCEHKERYMPFMEFLLSEGYACVIHDHRGHGESISDKEDLGYFHEGGWTAMVDDIHIVRSWIASLFPDKPVILFGHSMGSMAVRVFCKKHDSEISGLIVCGSPSYNPGSVFGRCLASVIGFICGDRTRPDILHKLSFGMFNSKFRHEGSGNSWICSDKSVVDAYDKDPLCNFQFTVNGFGNLFGLMSETYSKKNWNVGNRSLPVLFISGKEDPCLGNIRSHLRSVGMFSKAGYSNVSYKLYDFMRHEILNEKGKEIVWNDIVKFIESVI